MKFLTGNISPTDINNIVKAINGNWISYIPTIFSTFTSLALVIVTYFSLIKNLNLQKDKILSDNRITWLNGIENDVSSYLGIVDEINNIFAFPDDNYQKNMDFSRDLRFRLSEKESIIKLKILNKNEHDSFLQLLEELNDLCLDQLTDFKRIYCSDSSKKQKDDDFFNKRKVIYSRRKEMVDKRNKLVENTRSMLKKKWEENKKHFDI
ncbi:hypothetical protein [Fructilactobacillus frigidiflavus]|uniref:hypothetical protein n=1 Tax=Fructilactobacillus frigidiflavus TaxID=3242688 RepID=UPI003756D34C